MQLYKNEVVTNTSVAATGLRKRELDYYTNNNWTWGSCATVMAGFVFEQLKNPVPEKTDFYLEFAYLFFTAGCLGMMLCIITWTVLCCVWGPGMCLRGPEGMRSFHKTIDFLKSQQETIYNMFNLGVTFYFFSSCTLVWVYPSRKIVNTCCMVILGIFLLVIIYFQVRLDRQLKGDADSRGATDGHIGGFDLFDRVADLDAVASRVGREGDGGAGSRSYTGTHSNGA